MKSTLILLAALAGCFHQQAVATGTLPPGETPVLAQPEPPPSVDEETPPLSAARIGGEIVIGSLFGFMGMMGGAYAGYSLECHSGCGGEFGGLGGALLGGLAGVTLAFPFGVHFVGSNGDETGSYGAAVLGMGGSIGLGLLAAMGTGGDESASVLFLLASPIAGIVAYNATRHYKTPRRNPVVIVPVHAHEQTMLTLSTSF